MVCLANKLHHIWATAALLGIPKAEALRFDSALDEAGNGWAESLLLIASDPDEIPVRRLETCRQSGTQSCACAYTNSALVKRRCVRDACEFQLTRPNVCWRVVDKSACKVALYATNKIVVLCVSALGDDAECVILGI